jgi:hypothetical protein
VVPDGLTSTGRLLIASLAIFAVAFAGVGNWPAAAAAATPFATMLLTRDRAAAQPYFRRPLRYVELAAAVFAVVALTVLASLDSR